MSEVVLLDGLPDEDKEFICIWRDELGLNCGVFFMQIGCGVSILESNGTEFRDKGELEQYPWECYDNYQLMGESDD